MRDLRRQELQHRRVLRKTVSPRVLNDIAGRVPDNDVRLASNHHDCCGPDPNPHTFAASGVLVECRPLNVIVPMYLELSDDADALNDLPNAVLKLRICRVLRDPEGGDGFARLDEQVVLGVPVPIRCFEEVRWPVPPFELSAL